MNIERNRRLFISKLNLTISQESPEFIKTIINSKRFGKSNKCRLIIKKLTPHLDESADLSERIYSILHNLYDTPLCENCKTNSCKWSGYFKNGYNKFCSSKCSSIFNKDKIKNSYFEKTGYYHPSQNPDIIKKKEQSYFEKTGYTNASKNPEILKLKKENYFNKTGFNEPLSNPDVIKKKEDTLNKKYGVINISQNPDVIKKISEKKFSKYYDSLISSNRLDNHYIPNFTKEEFISGKGIHNHLSWKCIKCNTIFDYMVGTSFLPRCPKCYPYTISTGEKELFDFCFSKNNNIIQNSRKIISPFEIDLYLPNLNIGIEFNGLYWHSELNGKSPIYHLEKYRKCQKHNIHLIQIFEDEWINKKDIVKSILSSKFGTITNKIYARKCQINKLSNSDGKLFLNNNHIQGEINGEHVELFYNNELVSMITYGKTRFNNKNELELYRFCNKLDTLVVGGLSKLINYLKLINSGKKLISFADLRYSSGKGYLKCGFKLNKITPPSYWYILKNKPLERHNRINFQKHKLKDILENYNPNLTEWENMKNNGYDRIWDCGNLKLEI